MNLQEMLEIIASGKFRKNTGKVQNIEKLNF